MQDTLVTLIATLELEETLVDWLLDRDYRGFTTFDCAATASSPACSRLPSRTFGAPDPGRLLAGNAPSGGAEPVERLGVDLAGAGLHYWLTPLLAAGRIGGSTRPD
ncbi:MAG: hypothetical protein R3E53_22250 [Myxococcota bacterium]